MTEEQRNTRRNELRGKLTPKQLLFCHRYIIHWNGAQAARDAGYTSCFGEIAVDNLRKPHIHEYISLIKEDLTEELHLTKSRILQEWMKIAFSNVSDFMDIDELGCVSFKEGMTLAKLPRELSDIIESVKEGKHGLEITFHDKTRALSELSKMMDYNAPVVINAKVDTTTTLDYSKLSPEALEEIVKLSQNEKK